MAKRNANAIVLLSSDDEDDKSSLSLRSYSKLKPKPKPKPSLTRSEPRRAKKPRVSASQSRSRNHNSSVDEFQFFGDDFDQVFHRTQALQYESGSEKSRENELWVDRYKPSALEELAVHKKKVDEVKAWIEEHLFPSQDKNGDCVLLITGQAGVGKSATVRCIASLVGATVFEWNTPTPTVWQEHIYSHNAGKSYVSKLDEFEIFIDKVRKYGLVSPGLAGLSSSAVIVLIDDLPLAFSRIAYKRLQSSLHRLVQSARTPTIILITDCAQSDSADDTARSLEELKLFLENAGAYKIAFSPITNNSIKKTLSRICRQEQHNVTADQLDIIANASGGDIRQAITSLQFLCIEADFTPSSSLSDSTQAHEHNASSDRLTSHFGRDETLSLFHALGKFLHNKRQSDSLSLPDEVAFPLQEKFKRLPLKMESPEKVISQAHGQARPIAEFLHENVVDFIDEDAIDDAWAVLSYLVDADVLLDSSHRTFGRSNDIESVLQSVAASVAVRGVLFGNSHPSPSRWHAIRKPKLWQVEKSRIHNKDEMLRQRDDLPSPAHSYGLSVIATEYLPAFRRIQYTAPFGLDPHQQMILDGESGDDSVDNMVRDDNIQETEASDDEIEEW